jgi:hypothetical protein
MDCPYVGKSLSDAARPDFIGNGSPKLSSARFGASGRLGVFCQSLRDGYPAFALSSVVKAMASSFASPEGDLCESPKKK